VSSAFRHTHTHTHTHTHSLTAMGQASSAVPADKPAIVQQVRERHPNPSPYLASHDPTGPYSYPGIAAARHGHRRRQVRRRQSSCAHWLEHCLHPWTTIWTISSTITTTSRTKRQSDADDNDDEAIMMMMTMMMRADNGREKKERRKNWREIHHHQCQPGFLVLARWRLLGERSARGRAAPRLAIVEPFGADHLPQPIWIRSVRIQLDWVSPGQSAVLRRIESLLVLTRVLCCGLCRNLSILAAWESRQPHSSCLSCRSTESCMYCR
jgi:hypothetical protein